MFAAAIAALLLVLVHPFCSATYAATTAAHAAALSMDAGHTLPNTCCSDARDGMLAKPADLPIASMASGALVPAADSWIRVPAPSYALAQTALADPPQRSYYTRSARILR